MRSFSCESLQLRETITTSLHFDCTCHLDQNNAHLDIGQKCTGWISESTEIATSRYLRCTLRVTWSTTGSSCVPGAGHNYARGCVYVRQISAGPRVEHIYSVLLICWNYDSNKIQWITLLSDYLVFMYYACSKTVQGYNYVHCCYNVTAMYIITAMTTKHPKTSLLYYQMKTDFHHMQCDNHQKTDC